MTPSWTSEAEGRVRIVADQLASLRGWAAEMELTEDQTADLLRPYEAMLGRMVAEDLPRARELDALAHGHGGPRPPRRGRRGGPSGRPLVALLSALALGFILGRVEAAGGYRPPALRLGRAEPRRRCPRRREERQGDSS